MQVAFSAGWSIFRSIVRQSRAFLSVVSGVLLTGTALDRLGVAENKQLSFQTDFFGLRPPPGGEKR